MGAVLAVFFSQCNTHGITELYFLWVWSLRPPRGVCGAHLHQAYRPCAIGVMPSHKVCKLGGDELHRPSVVVLSRSPHLKSLPPAHHYHGIRSFHHFLAPGYTEPIVSTLSPRLWWGKYCIETFMSNMHNLLMSVVSVLWVSKCPSYVLTMVIPSCWKYYYLQSGHLTVIWCVQRQRIYT